jgi:hypothetical protein
VSIPDAVGNNAAIVGDYVEDIRTGTVMGSWKPDGRPRFTRCLNQP